MSSPKFIQNHYEKIILVALLILFSGLLYFQLSVIQNAQNKKVDDIINQEDPAPDYQLAGYQTDPHYSEDSTFASALAWESWKNEDAKSKVDMMTPRQHAVCPLCYWLVPADCFPKMGSKESGKCPHCKKELKPRSSDTETVSVAAVSDDSNDNGINDKWEVKYGIFKNKGEDTDPDPDKDGFSNLEEFKAKTNPTDPKSHPAYASKLVLADLPSPDPVEKFMLQNVVSQNPGKKLYLQGVNIDSKNPAKSFAYFKFTKPETAKRDTRMKIMVGDEILYRRKNSSDGKVEPVTGFKLVKLEPADEAKKVKAKAYIVATDPKAPQIEFVCVENEPIMTPYSMIRFFDPVSKKEISSKTGETIELGTDKTGIEKYQVVGVKGTGDATVVTLKNGQNKTFTIKLQDSVSSEKQAEPAVQSLPAAPEDRQAVPADRNGKSGKSAFDEFAKPHDAAEMKGFRN